LYEPFESQNSKYCKLNKTTFHFSTRCCGYRLIV